MHGHPDLLWRADAVERVLELRRDFVAGVGTEAVELSAIGGRVLASDVVADADAPPVSRATMDGFAFDATREYPFDVHEGEVFPESEPPVIDGDEAVRVATGAAIPERANAVLKREESTVEDGRLTGPPLSSGTYVYERGSNFEAGETLFSAGDRLSPKDAILLGDLGYDAVEVRDRLSVGVLATGTEIHEGRSRDLDSAMLLGLVESWGHEASYLGSVPDDYDRVESIVTDAAADHDVVMTTGGTSVGHKDYAVRALDALGDVLFHRVRIRPGKPIAVATLPDHDAVAFAIPGKPLGAHLSATLVARPFFVGSDRLAGVDATMTRDVGLGPDGFEYVVPVTLDGDEATPLGQVDSPLAVYEETFDPSVVSASTRATRADGVVVTTAPVEAGEDVTVIPFASLE